LERSRRRRRAFGSRERRFRAVVERTIAAVVDLDRARGPIRLRLATRER